MPISASLASPGPLTTQPITATLSGLSIFNSSFSTSSANFEFEAGTGNEPDAAKIDDEHYLVTYDGPWSIVLKIDLTTWAITTSSAAFRFDDSGSRTAISKINSTHFLVPYTGPDTDGWSAVLNPTTPNVIPVEYTEYATSSLNYASGTDLVTDTDIALELDLSKPTSNPSTSTDDIYWGLGIPSYVDKGDYGGTNTLEAKAD